MAKKKPQVVSANIGQDLNGNLIIGDGNTVNVYPQPSRADSYIPPPFPPLNELPEPADFLPLGSRMPFHRNRVFTGRETDLLALAHSLVTHHPSAATAITQTAAATGMGGIGKTQLAVEFCYRYGRYFHGVYWINAREGSLDSEIAACGREMGLPNFPETTPEQVALTLREWQKQPLRLVVLDNLEEPKILSEWLPRLNGLRILVTARRPQWSADLGVDAHPLDTLPRPDSLALLRKLAPRLKDTPEVDLDPLAERLGDLPLALDLAGRYLHARPTLTVVGYLQRLDETGNALEHTSLAGWVKDTNPTAHETSLAATFLLSWQQLGDNEVDKLAKKFFIASGYLASGVPIPQAIFFLISLPSGKRKKAKKVAGEKLKEVTDEAIWRIKQIGFFTENLVVHPLVAEFARIQAANNAALTELARKLAFFSMHAVETDIPDAFSPLRLHIERIFFFAEQYKLKEAGNLINSLGYYHNTMAEYSAALDSYKLALGLWEKAYGTEHHLIAIAFNNLGYTYNIIGDFASAKTMFERAKDLDEKLYGLEHPDAGTRFNNLGCVYNDLGDFSTARTLLEKALEIDEKFYGTEHPNVSRDANSLGVLLMGIGDLQDAKVFLERALEIDEKIYGSEHPDIVIHSNNLGQLFQKMGDLSSAKTLYERSLSLAKKFNGDSHPIIAKRFHNLAALLDKMGELPEALDYAKRAVAMYQKYLPIEHPDVKNALGWLKTIEQKIVNDTSS